MHILLVILAFFWWWPIGLLALGFVLARRGGCFRRAAYAGDGQMMGWTHSVDRWERRVARAQEKVERMRERAARRGWFTPGPLGGGSGNAAFDEYREETLRRLEEEQKEFRDFLERLRVAKDRAEFDAFMNQRRPSGPAPQEPPPQA
jgi:hypothetical protein